MFEQYEDQGFMPITMMTEGGLKEWADAYELTHPVVADRGFPYYSQFVDSSTIGMPSKGTNGLPGLDSRRQPPFPRLRTPPRLLWQFSGACDRFKCIKSLAGLAGVSPHEQRRFGWPQAASTVSVLRPRPHEGWARFSPKAPTPSAAFPLTRQYVDSRRGPSSISHGIRSQSRLRGFARDDRRNMATGRNP